LKNEATNFDLLESNIKGTNKLQREVITIRIMLDAMYDGMQEYLEEVGWSVITVKDIESKNAKDSKVRKHARTNDMILVTQDKK